MLLPPVAAGRRIDALDGAALAGVLAGEDDDVSPLRISGTFVARTGGSRGHHSTSGASETIFM